MKKIFLPPYTLWRKALIIFSVITITGIKTVAQTETFSSGSIIVNMGVTPQTVNNALRPYGMIYDLMRNQNVPIKWVINPTKIKDGDDFTYNGKVYKGGPFIIDGAFRNAAVNALMLSWVTSSPGMDLDTVGTTLLTVSVAATLVSVPRWTLNAQNGGIAQGFLTAAGITNTGFSANAYNWKLVAALDCCDDFFVMPHADPTWATHNRLYTWNQDCLGAIWAGCHAVSALENSINPANTTQQMNFLSTRTAATSPTPWPNNSLKLWGTHSGGSVPYTHSRFADPVAQYIGSTDAAQLNGSEQIYIPKQSTDAGGATRWRPETNIVAYDASQANVPAPDYGNGNVAAVIAYGRGLGQSNRGYVMYEASHNIGGTGPANIAAQRVFWNFSFFQVLPKAPQLTVTGIMAGQIIPGTTTIAGLNVVATSPLTGITFTYQWISSCGGTFSNPTGATTNFTAPTVGSNTPCIVSIKVSDNCGRTSVQSFPVTIKAANPPTVANDAAALDPGCGDTPNVTTNVLANDSDPNGDPITLTQVNGNASSPFTIPGQGTVSFTSSGDVTFTMEEGFTGVVNLTYQVCDNTTPVPLCSNGTYNISVGDANKIPTVTNDAVSIAEDVLPPASINVLANDVQGGGYTGGALSVRSVISGPANGRVSVNPDNTITYIPNADFAGTDNFTYEVVNVSGYRRSAVVTVTVINNSCDAGTYEVSPPVSGTATYQMSNAPAPPTTFGDAMISQIVLALNNWGADTELEVNADNGAKPRRTLAQFSLAGIPGGATITNSQLRLVRTNGNNTAQNIGAYRVTTAWNEGTGNNNANTAIINGSTWFTTSFTSYWQNAGGDFTTTDGAVTSVSTNTGGIGGTAIYGWNVTAITQGWYAGTFTNNGLILKDELENNGNDKVFGSLNHGTAANRPVLRVTYEVTAGVPVVVDIQASKDTWIQHEENYEDVFGTSNANNQFQVNANGSSNQAGRLLFKFDLSAPTSGTVPPPASTISSAALTLNRTGGDNTAVTIGVYQATNSWNEANGTNTANTALLNGATWHTRSFTQVWNSPGGEFNLTPTSSQNVLATGAYNWDVLGIVQNWFDATPDPNHGFLAKAVTENVNLQHEFASRQNATATLRPTLVINYNSPAVCGAVPNREPLANPDYGYITNSITALVISDVKNNDTDEGALTVTGAVLISGSGAVGSVTANGFTFTPTSGVTGTAVVEYTISDGTLTDVARVFITVTNAPLSATNDVSSANSGVVQNINVMTNDTDPENQKGVLSILTPPANGTAVVNDNGTPANFADDFIAYTPNAGYTGSDAFTYQICEDFPVAVCPVTPYCATAMVNVTVVNQPPVANNDGFNFAPCQPIIINLVGNDTDPEAGVLTVNIVTLPVTGTLVNNNDGTVTYTPITGTGSPITFTYTITDNGVVPLTSVPATVMLTLVTPVNNPPAAGNDVTDPQYMGEVFYTSVLDNDSDPDNNPLTLPVITVQPLYGTASVLPNGLIEYIPNPGWYGSDILTYQICDIISNPATCAQSNGTCVTATVSYIILPPANTTNAYNDEHSTWQDVNVSNNVLINDADAESDAQVLRGFFDKDANMHVTSGTFNVYAEDEVTLAGAITVATNGDFTFDPLPAFIGIVSVPYYIIDIVTPAGSKPESADTALLKITVNPLPVVTNSIIANNDEYATPLNTNVVNSVTAYNDFDPQGNSFTVTSYTFDSDGNGTQDGAGTLASAIQIGGISTTGIPTTNAGTLLLNTDGTFTFNPKDDFTGNIDVVYAITDALGAATTAVLHIDVLPDTNGAANDVPFAGDDFKYTNVNTPVNGNALANDSDPNGHTITATPQTTTIPGVGTLVLAADGSYTFTPAAGYTGPSDFPYTICDNQVPALCTEATVHFLVGIDNSTDAINDENSTWQDVKVDGNVLANDFDAENNTQTFGSFLLQNLSGDLSSGATVGGTDKTGTPVANAGTLTFAADGTYTFDPAPAFTGTVSVPYRICDNGNLGKCDTAYLTITVDPLPEITNAVIANNDENVSYGSPVSSNVTLNDDDPQQTDNFTVTAVNGVPANVGTPITVSGADQYGNAVANAGTLIINADGSYTYNPASGFVGSITVPYTITDNNTSPASSTAILHIDVLKDPNGPANDPPFGGDDFKMTTLNTPVTGSVLLNDSDPNGNALTVTAQTTTIPGVGTLTLLADGTYTFAPATGYVGPAVFYYQLCDGQSPALCAVAELHFLVSPQITLPVTRLVVSVRLNGGNAFVDWKTETEINSDHFVVERSIDNSNYTSVGTVAAAGNSTTRLLYSFTDDVSSLLQSGIIYYRIRQVDIDNRFMYSNIAAIRLDKSIGITSWPNPFSSAINISFRTNVNTQITVRLMNAAGQTLQSSLRNVSGGAAQITISNLDKLANGLYILEVMDLSSGKVYTEKFMKQ